MVGAGKEVDGMIEMASGFYPPINLVCAWSLVVVPAQPSSRESAASYWMLVALLAVAAVALLFRWRVTQIRKHAETRLQHRQEVMQTEMKALRSQMNPHFIFNAINSIQHFVLTNEKEQASKYLVKFSKLMRNILELSKEDLISLSEELETIRLYLEIESLRFNNAFRFNVEVAQGMDLSQIRVPPMLIQPFVENAIWHGLLPKDDAKLLDIRVKRDGNETVIQVDDNGIGRAASAVFRKAADAHRSLGMDITAERMRLFRANGINVSLEVVDKFDEAQKASGTLVSIKLKG